MFVFFTFFSMSFFMIVVNFNYNNEMALNQMNIKDLVIMKKINKHLYYAIFTY